MPYRRLPNTDVARLKALTTAYRIAKEVPPFKLAFSQKTFQKLQSFLPGFENLIIQYKKGVQIQADKNKGYGVALKKAKMYISHFIQVVNMSVMRGDLPKTTKAFFDLDEDEKRTPNLNSENDIITWGKKIILGEEQRKFKGLSPVTNPTIALVKIHFENFKDGYNYQKTLQKSNQRNHEQLAKQREVADDIILDIWNEVEQSFSNLPDGDKRAKASEYGVAYVFRKHELVEGEMVRE